MPRRPNILLVVTDQQRPDLVGALGRVAVQTPHLDRLCAEGTAFLRGYVSCPLCTPSRASLLSGQYPSRHGAWSIGIDAPQSVLSLPRLLTQAGYRTGHIGKSHFQSNTRGDTLESAPASQDWEFFERWSGPWYGFEHARLHVGHGDEPHAYCMHYGLFLRRNGIPPEPPYFARADETHGYGAPRRWELPEKFHTSTWAADEAIAFLDDQAARPDQPFYLSVNFPDPHGPFLVPAPWDTLHANAPLPPPVRRHDEVERNGTTLYRATVERRLEQLGWHDRVNMPCQESMGRSPIIARTPMEEARWRIYMGMQSLVDKHFGRILDALRRNRQEEDTIVVFTSDHGDYMGDHWLWYKGGSHYDAAIRVPLIVRWPGQVPAGRTSGALHSLLDLPATFLSAAGEGVHPLMQGVDQRATWRDPARPSRSGVLVEHRVERGLTVNTWITDRHRLSVHSILAENRDELELYDLQADPNEFENRAQNPEEQQQVVRLMAEMMRHRQAISGPFPIRSTFA